jgi:DNA modification methylase
MAPEAAAKWLHTLPTGSRVLDPMCGSGVVLRQSAVLGHKSLGFDVDPLAVLMSKVWTRKGDSNDLVAFAELVQRSARRRRINHLSLPWVSNCGETQSFIEYWFAEPQRSDLSKLTTAIRSLARSIPKWAVDALNLALSRTVVTKQAGASLAWDVSHSRPHKTRLSNDYDVMGGFLEQAKRLDKLLDGRDLKCGASAYRGDCRNLKRLESNSIDAVITSPPYLNAIDYLRGHKFSLIWMGYTIPDLRNTRSTAVGTERAGSLLQEAFRELDGTIPSIKELPERQRNIVHRYATDLDQMIAEMSRVLVNSGQLVVVLGDSVLHGVRIPNSSIFQWVASKHGFRLRHLEVREIPPNHRYLPINTINQMLTKRMRSETIQVFSRAAT